MMQHSPFESPLLPTGKGFFNLAGGFCGGRPRSTTRAQEAASLTDEPLNFFVKATGKVKLRCGNNSRVRSVRSCGEVETTGKRAEDEALVEHEFASASAEGCRNLVNT